MKRLLIFIVLLLSGVSFGQSVCSRNSNCAYTGNNTHSGTETFTTIKRCNDGNERTVGTGCYATFAAAIATCPINGCRVVDSRSGTLAAQDAFDVPPGVTVELGAANYGFKGTIHVYNGGHLIGRGPNTSGGGTLIHSDGGQTYGDIVASFYTTGTFMHNASIENMTIDCFGATNTTAHGLNLFGSGETTHISNVYVQNCHQSNIRIYGQGTPARLLGVSSFNSDGAGFEFDFGYDGDSAAYGYLCESCSGDNNAGGLVKLSNGGDRSTITFLNLKSERRANASVNNPVITLNNYDGTVNIIGSHFFTGTGLAGTPSGDVVQITGTANGKVNIIGASQRLYTNWINDTVNSKTLATFSNYLPSLSWMSGGTLYTSPSGYIQSFKSATGQDAFIGSVQGEGNPRWRITSDGQFQMGPGTTTYDNVMRRGASTITEFTQSILSDKTLMMDAGTGATGRATLTHANTATRTYTFPDKAITVAGTADIPKGTWSPFHLGSTVLNQEYAVRTDAAAIAIKRVQLFTQTIPAGCTTVAQLCVYDGSACVANTTITLVNGTQKYDSGAITSNVNAGTALTIRNVQAPAGCTTNAGNLQWSIEYAAQ